MFVHRRNGGSPFFPHSGSRESVLTLRHTELYLELHRGTATSHGSIKKGNRKSEILLREIEYAATLASTGPSTKGKYTYPKDQLDPLWEGGKFPQFLRGSDGSES